MSTQQKESQRDLRTTRTLRELEASLIERVVKEILLILLRLHFRRDESRCDCEMGSALLEIKTM